MNLAKQWEKLTAGLPSDWVDARVQLTLESPSEIDRAATLLGSLQPVVSTETISLRTTRGGSGATAFTVRRALGRLDAERIHGTLALISVEGPAELPSATAAATLAESWDAAVATLPSDWSDVLAQIELDSSDYIEPGALHLAPLNPRRVGERLALRFRSASGAGYGASAGMVRRCLERCDAAGIRGSVHILRALSGTQSGHTQGPVWHIDGDMV